MTTHKEFHARSLQNRDAFWTEEAKRIDWHKPFTKVLDYSRPPFAKWFVGGETNLCHNAVDRHLAPRGEQKALVWISTEVDQEQSFTYRQLYAEVNRVAAMMQALGVGRGDRVIIYMPNTPEAVFAILACARIGAIHSVVRPCERLRAAVICSGKLAPRYQTLMHHDALAPWSSRERRTGRER